MKTQSASVLITTPPVLPPHLFAKPTVLSTTVPQRKRYRLPSVLMRSGTSRGLFIHRHHLPRSHAEWGAILIGAMGSRNGDPRQLEGVGGATSTTSKAVVVSKSDRPGIDIEYTFVQITVGQEKVDMTGNCGNMASGVAAFALEEGLVKAAPGQSEISVRIFNTNTSSTLIETIQVDSDGHFIEEGSYQISGVKGSGSRIKVSFLNPGGTMTGKIFPTGNTIDDLLVRCKGLPQPFIVRVSLIDVSNPFIFIDGNTMPSAYKAVGPDEGIALEIIEAIRRVGSVKYGFATDVETAGLRRGTPKIAIVSSPSGLLPDEDFHVLAYSMGKVHPSLQVTGAVCLGAAASLEGTVVWEAMARGIETKDGPVSKASTDIVHEENVTKERRIVIGHGSGTIDVEVDSGNESGSTGDIKMVTVFRTARRLFEGTILVPV